MAMRKGIQNVTVDELVEYVTPKAREAVPDALKNEIVSRIRTFLSDSDALKE
jgi:enhancer of yellow 2 transcription factor